MVIEACRLEVSMWSLMDSEIHLCPVMLVEVEDSFVSSGWHNSWTHNLCRNAAEGEIV